jgi:SAM-dependent methyltransferase
MANVSRQAVRSLALSRTGAAVLIALAGIVLVHYGTPAPASVHYATIGAAAGVVLMGALRLSLAECTALAVAAGVALAGDALWRAGATSELIVEGVTFAVLLVALPMVCDNTQTFYRSALRKGMDPVEFWDYASRNSAMARYIAGVEEAFLTRTLDAHPGPLDVVVDAGAGTGRFSRMLAPRAARVVATEVSAPAISRLAAIAPNVEAVQVIPTDTRLPVEDAAADCVVCIEVPELTVSSWFYEECGRVLKPGGLLLVTINNGRSWKGLVAALRRGKYRMKTGSSMYGSSLPELAARLRSSGLRVEEAQGFNWLPFPRVAGSPLIPPLAALERLLGLRRLPGVSPWVIVRAVKDGSSDGARQHETP